LGKQLQKYSYSAPCSVI